MPLPSPGSSGTSCQGDAGLDVLGSLKPSWKGAVPKVPCATVCGAMGGTTTGLDQGTHSFVSTFCKGRSQEEEEEEEEERTEG